MIKDVINKEDIQEFIKEMNLFVNYNEDISVDYLMNKSDESSYVSHISNVSFDCLEIFKKSNYEIHLLWKVKDKLQDDFKTVKKYFLTGSFSFLDVRINQNNFNKWKNTEMKKLREYVKKYYHDVHSLQVKYRKDDLYPRIKITFKRDSYATKWRISSDISKYAHESLGFSNQIKIDW